MTTSNIYTLKKCSFYNDTINMNSKNTFHQIFAGCLDGRLLWLDIYQTLLISKNDLKELHSSIYFK